MMVAPGRIQHAIVIRFDQYLGGTIIEGTYHEEVAVCHRVTCSQARG